MNLFLVFVTLASTVLGGTLQIIDHQGQCFVYSTHNFDCTGVSEPFAPLDGVSCSSKRSTDPPMIRILSNKLKVNSESPSNSVTDC